HERPSLARPEARRQRFRETSPVFDWWRHIDMATTSSMSYWSFARRNALCVGYVLLFAYFPHNPCTKRGGCELSALIPVARCVQTTHTCAHWRRRDMKLGLDVGYSGVKLCYGTGSAPAVQRLPVGAGPARTCVVDLTGENWPGSGQSVLVRGEPWVAGVDPVHLSDFERR